MSLSFSCGACPYHGDVEILGVGQGAGVSPLGLDDRFARGRADDAAVDAARQDARTLLRITPCPRCGARNAAGVQDFALKSAALALVPSAVVGAGIWVSVAAQASTPMPAWVVAIPCAFLSLLLLLVSVRPQWKAATTRVHHLPPLPPESAP